MRKIVLGLLLSMATLALYFCNLPAVSAFDNPVQTKTTSFVAVGADTPLTTALGSQSLYWRINWYPVGAPGSCSVQVDYSVDNISWTGGGVIASQSCTTPGTFTASTPAAYNYVRMHVTALSASTSVTVILSGFATNPLRVGPSGSTGSTGSTGATGATGAPGATGNGTSGAYAFPTFGGGVSAASTDWLSLAGANNSLCGPNGAPGEASCFFGLSTPVTFGSMSCTIISTQPANGNLVFTARLTHSGSTNNTAFVVTFAAGATASTLTYNSSTFSAVAGDSITIAVANGSPDTTSATINGCVMAGTAGSIPGPQGPTGATGPGVGATGPTGATGATGPGGSSLLAIVGTTGQIGVSGSTGPTGIISITSPLTTPGDVYPASSSQNSVGLSNQGINQGVAPVLPTGFWRDIMQSGNSLLARLSPFIGNLTGTPQSGSGLNVGQYTYTRTFVTPSPGTGKSSGTAPASSPGLPAYFSEGETQALNQLLVTTTSGNQQVALTSPCSTDPRAYGLNWYRGTVGLGGGITNTFLIPAGSGTVNISGTSITGVTGTTFSSTWVGRVITANPTPGNVLIDAVITAVADSTHMTTSTSLPTGTGVAYYITPTQLQTSCSAGSISYVDSTPDANLGRMLPLWNSTGGNSFAESVSTFLQGSTNAAYGSYPLCLGWNACNLRMAGIVGTVGGSVVVVGGDALGLATNAGSVVSIGSSNLALATQPSSIVAAGTSVFPALTTGSGIGVGTNVGATVTTETGNILLGDSADITAGVNGCTALGTGLKCSKSSGVFLGVNHSPKIYQYTASGAIAAGAIVKQGTADRVSAVTTSDTAAPLLGIAVVACTNGNPCAVAVSGYISMLADGGITVGDLIGVSTGTAGYGTDIGATPLSSLSSVGIMANGCGGSPITCTINIQPMRASATGIVPSATGRVTAQTAANASIASLTVGSSDTSYYVSGEIEVTTSTLYSFTMTVTYFDPTNTSRTATFNFSNLGGTLSTVVANTVAGAPLFEGVPLHIRAKAGTTITIATAAGGTYTTVTYNAEGRIISVGN